MSQEQTVAIPAEITADDLDLDFGEEKGFDAAKLGTCLQCGTCSSSCPTYFAMDNLVPEPATLVLMGLAGVFTLRRKRN